MGHGGLPCIEPSTETITILHTNAIHRVRVMFCGCGTDVEQRHHYNQLLDAQLFPASFTTPKTVFTFTLLDTLCTLTMRGKVSVYDYYQSLRCLSDNCELRGLASRYDELGLAVRRYRNLLSLKRAGIAHNPNGIADMQEGDLAVDSPASPLPGKNLPPNWKTVFMDKPHLHAQFLALDANFRLKLKDRNAKSQLSRSQKLPEPSLTGNGGFFVDEILFRKELDRVQDKPPDKPKNKSSCDSSFAAIERSNSRFNRGFIVTGVVAAIDSRHGTVLANGVADLQKGERYFNTDFVFLSSLRRRGLDTVYVSYDVACQWEKFLDTRCEFFPIELRSHLGNLTIICAIPKFHLPAHGFICWSRYSLNFIPGSARVDGEAIERHWAATNPVATSTREMTPGARHDFLEDRWAFQNFKKLVGLGDSLERKLRSAISGVEKHEKELEELSSSQAPSIIEEWTAMVNAYHEDPASNPDPYRVRTQGMYAA